MVIISMLVEGFHTEQAWYTGTLQWMKLSKYYVDYVNKHRSDKDFDPSIYSSDPYNIYGGDDVI